MLLYCFHTVILQKVFQRTSRGSKNHGKRNVVPGDQDILITGNNVSFTVVLTTPACPLKDLLKNNCVKAIQEHVSPDANVKVNFTSNTTSIRKETAVLPGVRNIIAVISGKG